MMMMMMMMMMIMMTMMMDSLESQSLRASSKIRIPVLFKESLKKR